MLEICSHFLLLKLHICLWVQVLIYISMLAEIIIIFACIYISRNVIFVHSEARRYWNKCWKIAFWFLSKNYRFLIFFKEIIMIFYDEWSWNHFSLWFFNKKTWDKNKSSNCFCYQCWHLSKNVLIVVTIT